MLNVQLEISLFVFSILFFVSILAGKASSRFGVPALLLFLGVGMLFGSDGFGIQFENIKIAQTIGTIALCIILFSGGMDTQLSEIRPVAAQGVILATVGVFLTAIITGLFYMVDLREDECRCRRRTFDLVTDGFYHGFYRLSVGFFDSTFQGT